MWLLRILHESKLSLDYILDRNFTSKKGMGTITVAEGWLAKG